MTPKEKAIELTRKFLSVTHRHRSDSIKCALICVDEILGTLDFDSVDSEPYSSKKVNEIFEYWQEVKQEIQNL